MKGEAGGEVYAEQAGEGEGKEPSEVHEQPIKQQGGKNNSDVTIRSSA